MKLIKINGVDFALKREVKNYNDIVEMDFKSLADCYSKCSHSKIAVFDYWRNVLKEATLYGVNSYNANMITLHALIKLEDKLYYVYISKTKNDLYEAQDEE